MTPIDKIALQGMFDAQYALLSGWNQTTEGSKAICAGRAAGLAWDLGLEKTAQAIWSKEIPAAVGMPSFAEFRAAYEANPDGFAPSATGAGIYTAPGTSFSNAAGSYAWALDVATKAKTPAGEDSAEYWSGDHGKRVLTQAGFAQQQGEQLMQAITTGAALAMVKTKTV